MDATYKVSCRNFCNIYAKCQSLKDKMAFISEDDKKRFAAQFHLVRDKLNEARADFAAAKEQAGYGDGFKFIEDCFAFQGFELDRGRVKGDYREALRWAAFNAQAEDNNLKFELAQLILQGAAVEEVKSYA